MKCHLVFSLQAKIARLNGNFPLDWINKNDKYDKMI